MSTNNNYAESELILKSLCPYVRKICQPMFDYLSISFFRYVRSYPNNEKYIMCTDENWIAAYFENEVYDLEYANYYKIPKIGSGISIHAVCTSDDPICVFWNKMSDETNYNFILALYEKYDAYLEFYNFGLSKEIHAGNNIFLNNHNLFHHFITYFRENAQELFLQAEKVKFKCKETNYEEDVSNNWMLGLSEDYEKMVIEQMPVTKVYLDGYLDNVHLTKDEAIFAKHLLSGHHAEQIKEKMHLSLEKLKALEDNLLLKLKVGTEKDLRSILTNNRIQKKLAFIR
ncbi:hypothetical protein [Candidatus Berkiella aquae]|uniref:HTH luxR-type domain-containing protein n=1 Tax=Candidatus Berkiella aquae TaxID=295108 RepID=A0A0Q9YCV9_9GAMM|nr:hypothetical protein [Candidatus Berkiella aquae]MCS5711676.1 hypothetical protein [Candidatus Berkiella aquae]